MPSFFQALKRFIQGKPVFDANDSQTVVRKGDTGPPPLVPLPVQQEKLSSIRKGNHHTFPIIEVRRTLTRFSGPNMQIYCYLRNRSPEEIVLDKIRILGTIYEIDSFLHPGQEREYKIYDGPRLKREDHHEAAIQYKTKDGDYFEAPHDLKFHYHKEDGSYSVEAMHLNEPIRDIFG